MTSYPSTERVHITQYQFKKETKNIDFKSTLPQNLTIDNFDFHTLFD